MQALAKNEGPDIRLCRAVYIVFQDIYYNYMLKNELFKCASPYEDTLSQHETIMIIRIAAHFSTRLRIFAVYQSYTRVYQKIRRLMR